MLANCRITSQTLSAKWQMTESILPLSPGSPADLLRAPLRVKGFFANTIPRRLDGHLHRKNGALSDNGMPTLRHYDGERP
jgi:hypothetical protein